MRVLAQSTLAPASPHLHLGYLAAAFHDEDANPAWGIGSIVLAVMGGLLLLRSVFLRKRSTRQSYNMANVGVVLLFTAIGAYWMWDCSGRGGVTYQNRSTKMDAYFLVKTLEDWPLKTDKPLPDTMETLVETNKYNIHDYWQHPMRMQRELTSAGWVYTLTSAGKDGQFGTQDDIVVRSEPILVPPQATSQPVSQPGS